MQPQADGGHDALPDQHTTSNPRTEQWMEEILEPLMDQLIAEEGDEGLTAFLIESAERMEDHLRIHDPDSELLVILEEHRKKRDGFC